jgi:hypothetical protein
VGEDDRVAVAGEILDLGLKRGDGVYGKARSSHVQKYTAGGSAGG